MSQDIRGRKPEKKYIGGQSRMTEERPLERRSRKCEVIQMILEESSRCRSKSPRTMTKIIWSYVGE